MPSLSEPSSSPTRLGPCLKHASVLGPRPLRYNTGPVFLLAVALGVLAAAAWLVRYLPASAVLGRL